MFQSILESADMITEKVGNLTGAMAFVLSGMSIVSSYNQWLDHFDQHGTAYGFFVSAFVALVHFVFKWLHYRRKMKSDALDRLKNKR